MEIMVGGNIIRRVEGDDSKTHFTVLTHVNPGGVAETRLGAMILNSAAASGPLKFIHGLRKVALDPTPSCSCSRCPVGPSLPRGHAKPGAVARSLCSMHRLWCRMHVRDTGAPKLAAQAAV
jgi:hypothetical protein